MKEAVIVSGARTAVGRAPRGSLRASRPDDMAGAAIAEALRRADGLDLDKLNVNGGAIALGHPMGATGTKLTIQLLAELARRGGRYGMVTMCVGGGQGAAGIFENLQN